MDSPKKIYPSADDLSKINSMIPCPEEGCSNVFMSESNLNLHLVKTHKKEHLMQTDNTVKEYHCPEHSCVYNVTKFFKNLKLLKQHFLKVHGAKTFGCDSCEMKFSTQAIRNSHSQFCGVQFSCCDCTSSYPSYESLLTHGRRKKHKILEKALYKVKATPVKSSSISNVTKLECAEQFILPKSSTSLQLVNCYPIDVSSCKATFEKSSQTDVCLQAEKQTKRTQIGKKLHHLHNSQQTQTLNKSLAAETQTIGDYFVKKATTVSDIAVEENWSRKSIKTQTKPVDSTTKSCNTSFNLDDFDFCDVKTERNSSSTQTAAAMPNELFYSMPVVAHDSTHTDTSDINFEFMHSSSQTSFKEEMETFASENFFSSETQTDFMSMLNSDYCSNMYTQTCDDVLLNDLGFNTSQTQTVLDDVLRSVESQTMMSSHYGGKVLTCRDMANMETQTDIEFKQMLEEINA